MRLSTAESPITRRLFFSERYLQEHPEDQSLVDQLQELFAQQIPLIESAMVIHRSRVNEQMQPLQQRIEMCFTQVCNERTSLVQVIKIFYLRKQRTCK